MKGSSQAPQQRPHSLPGDSLRSQHRTSVPIIAPILQRSLLCPASHGQLTLTLAPMEAVHSPWPVSGGLWPDTPAASVPQTDSFPSLPARCPVHLQGVKISSHPHHLHRAPNSSTSPRFSQKHTKSQFCSDPGLRNWSLYT